MDKQSKEKIGEEAFEKLKELYRRECNIFNIPEDRDVEVQKRSLELFLIWLSDIYQINKKQKEQLADLDDSLEGLFETQD